VLGVLLVGAVAGAGATVLLDDAWREDVTAGGDVARLVPESGPVTLALAGDVRPGQGLAGMLDSPDPVEGLAALFDGADLVVAQLAAALVDEPPSDPGEAAWAPSGVLDALAGAGVDVLSMATDRGLDLGLDGLSRTLGVAEGRPVSVVGIGEDEDAAYAPVVRQLGGQTVAVIAATQLLAADRIASDTARPGIAGIASAKRVDRLVTEVRAASDVADVVVVIVHWGDPGATCPSVGQQELAAALVGAGADVVAGGGAGAVQGAGRLDGAVVGYGLGTLADDGSQEAGALLVRVEDGEVVAYDWAPARMSAAGVAEPLAGAEAEAAVAEWESRRDCTGLEP
jgi:poly-gamma-glutamate capsule biosynthesis protein CapA/YwtB (metallophosphatase superfamily)